MHSIPVYCLPIFEVKFTSNDVSNRINFYLEKKGKKNCQRNKGR